MYDKIFKGCSYLLLLFIVAAGVLAYVANSQVSGKPYVSKDRIETQFYLISHYEDLFARSLDQDSERYKILIKKIQEVQHTLILLNSGDDISVFQMHIYKATVERHNDAIDDLSQDFSENLQSAKKFYINKVKGDYKKLSSMPHNLFVSAINLPLDKLDTDLKHLGLSFLEVSTQLSDYNKYSTYSFYCIWIACLIVFIGFLALYEIQRVKAAKENNESEQE
tara:strand:+ start:439 stop:1104 length:666 start_codon:yes stop_codon:yes gene_type:complete